MEAAGAFYAMAFGAIAVQWPWFWPLVAAMLGAVMGSFLTCVCYRVPRGMSLRQPASHCPCCHTVLGVPDLVPIFSFVALRGRCRHCKNPIGLASLWPEIACALLGGGLGWAVQALLLA